MPAAITSLALRSLPRSRRSLLQSASRLVYGHIAKSSSHSEAVADPMLAKASRSYQANQPPPRNGLEKDLLPSSSPTPATGDIRDQMRKKPTQSGFMTSSPSQRANVQRVSRPLDARSGNMASANGGTGKGSLSALYKNSTASFKNDMDCIDLTDDTTAVSKSQNAVFFAEDDFSDDDDLDLDFKAPSAVSPSKFISVTSAPAKENMSPPPASARSTKSDVPIPWSSSPLSHFQRPEKLHKLSNTSDRADSSLKRESSGENESFETPAPKKAKKRALPSSFKQPKQEDDDDVVEVKPQAFATPGQKEGRGLWDPSASAIKEQKKQLRTQRNTKKEAAEDDSEDIHGERSKSVKARADTIALSSEQRYVIDLVVDKGQSVFFTGPAGTGKSVLMRAIINELKAKFGGLHSEKVAVTASTGLAACNIGGITLHSFSGIGLGKEDASTLVKKVRRNPKAKNRWLKTKCLIIDEISMVDGELFDKLSQIGRTIRNNGRPWGGIQLIVTGDFFQLPPVPDSSKGREAQFAFDAATWDTSLDHTIGLTQVFRQRDPEFANMLNEMRLGKISDATVRAFKALDRPLKFEDGVDLAELFPLRAQVEGSNERRLRDLPGPIHRFEAIDTGEEAIKDKLLANMMAPKAIELKEDAQVMLIKNLDESLVNGSLGKVIGFSDERTFEMGGNTSDAEDSAMSKARKKLSSFARDADLTSGGKKYPIVQFISASGVPRVILCQPEEWKVELPNGEVQAKRQQVPLILAWALSIHKAQGQTLERVTVNLGKVFEKGQAYVALSRATTQQGLRVVGFDKSKVMAHPKVVGFYSKLAKIDGSGVPRGILDFVAGRRGGGT